MCTPLPLDAKENPLKTRSSIVVDEDNNNNNNN